MLIFPCAALLLLLVLSWRSGGPLVSLSISWLVVMMPILFGLAQFRLLLGFDLWFEFTLMAYLSCFVGGAFFYRAVSRKKRNATTEIIIRESYVSNIPLAKFCLVLGWCGIAFLCLNFVVKGYSFEDFTALHQQFSTGKSSVLVALTNISLWACLYCYVFVLVYWRKLRVGHQLLFLSPVPGYLLAGLFNGGRQATFIFMLITILTFLLKIRGEKSGVMTTRYKIVTMVAVASFVGAYSAFIGVARNNDMISVDHAVVLRSLFGYGVTDFYNTLFSWNKPLSDFVEEFIAYFSATLPQFKAFLSTSVPIGFGANEYPFLARQLSPLTGIDYFYLLSNKRIAMTMAAAAPAGWPTAIASSIMDFGRGGAAVYLFIQGVYSEYIWVRARQTGKLVDYIVLLLVLMSAIYMSAFPLTTDTSCFLLWVFCLFLQYVGNPFATRTQRISLTPERPFLRLPRSAWLAER
jgi:oligosaccharide repeat unit polymerase